MVCHVQCSVLGNGLWVVVVGSEGTEDFGHPDALLPEESMPFLDWALALPQHSDSFARVRELRAAVPVHPRYRVTA